MKLSTFGIPPLSILKTCHAVSTEAKSDMYDAFTDGISSALCHLTCCAFPLSAFYALDNLSIFEIKIMMSFEFSYYVQ
jgi:hypothetical protein